MNTKIHTSKASPKGGGMEGALIFTLKRICIRKKTCDGSLYSEGGTRICDTAESAPYMLELGEYPLNPKSRLIQKGNGVYALRKSTIYVGTYLIPGVVKCSDEAYKKLHQRIKKARQRGKKIVLVVE